MDTARGKNQDEGGGTKMFEQEQARAEWTSDVVEVRRKQWTDYLLAAKKKGVKVKLREAEKEVGFRFADLCTAIRLNLKTHGGMK
jgi:hypothetical protein